MKILVLLNDPPYGTERSYNGLRLAFSLSRQADCEVKIFLIADAAPAVSQGRLHLTDSTTLKGR
jgi:uncharacterized protein involved in oxidation of intracellular sulfur